MPRLITQRFISFFFMLRQWLRKNTHMLANGTHPIALRHAKQGWSEARQVPPLVATVAQKNRLRMVLMEAFGALGVVVIRDGGRFLALLILTVR